MVGEYGGQNGPGAPTEKAGTEAEIYLGVIAPVTVIQIKLSPYEYIPYYYQRNNQDKKQYTVSFIAPANKYAQRDEPKNNRPYYNKFRQGNRHFLFS
jgi:hypothetical protein